MAARRRILAARFADGCVRDPSSFPPEILLFGASVSQEAKWCSVGRCFRHQLLLPRPYLGLTKPLRLDIQCQRGASVKIGWKYLDD